MNDYFEGAVRQLQERTRHLIGLIPGHLGRDVAPLEVICHQRLNNVAEQLRVLIETPEMQQPENQPLRLRRFRRALEELDLLESVAVAALRRWNEDDQRMNQLTGRIAREIHYPLTTPVVTCSSPWQQYYHTYPHLNLLSIPLAENQFLLHLPDLYHEFAHSLLTNDNDPRIELFQRAYAEALNTAHAYLAEELQKQERRRGPEALKRYLLTWFRCWEDWLTEFFCDLFAIYTVGPAFGWAHFHLCAGRGGNPVAVPTYVPATHPADAARMNVILEGLKRLELTQEAKLIGEWWDKLMNVTGVSETPEYRRCFPSLLLETIAEKAYEGTLGIGCDLAGPEMHGNIRNLLNTAWAQFWHSPQDYVAWERRAVTELNQDYSK